MSVRRGSGRRAATETRRIDGRRVELSNLDKVYFPVASITKGDLVDYYERVAPVMLPHLSGRPISMHRWPDGLGGHDFYHKEVPEHWPSWIRTVRVERRGGGAIRQVVVDDTATLVYLAQQACITPHVWLSRAGALERPDRLVLDFDPPGRGEGAFPDVRWSAIRARELLADVGLDAWVMLSGSRGLHIHCVLDGSATFEASRSLARAVACRLAERHPERLTIEQRKSKRRGRIFIDFLRNGYAQTTVAPYAVRALPGAPIAAPLEWSELYRTGLGPRRYTVRNLFRRLGAKRDPWAGMAGAPGADVSEAARRLDAVAADDGGA